jgi:hypothetical protein
VVRLLLDEPEPGGGWAWLADPARRDLLALWVEGYARSLLDPGGPWSELARQTVADWLDLLATGDDRRVTATVRDQVAVLARDW